MYDKSPCALHMGSREPPASVLGYDVKSQIAGQQLWVAVGHPNLWSPRYGDHCGILTGYGLPAHAGGPFSTTKTVASENRKLSPSSEFEKESAYMNEARSSSLPQTVQQRMLKTGEVQDVLQQPRETNQISDIDGLGHPIVAVTCYPSNHGMLNTEEDPPGAEKRGSP